MIATHRFTMRLIYVVKAKSDRSKTVNFDSLISYLPISW